jgi:hypothetical protein
VVTTWQSGSVATGEDAARRRRKRPSVSVGDVIEVTLGTGKIAYVHYCCDWKGMAVVRALPGRWERPLSPARLQQLVSGPDDFVKRCFVQHFVRGSGIEIVANIEAPEGRRSLPAAWLGGRRANGGDGYVQLADGTTQLSSEFARVHPELDLSWLPVSSICTSPIDLEDRPNPVSTTTKASAIPRLLVYRYDEVAGGRGVHMQPPMHAPAQLRTVLSCGPEKLQRHPSSCQRHSHTWPDPCTVRENTGWSFRPLRRSALIRAAEDATRAHCPGPIIVLTLYSARTILESRVGGRRHRRVHGVVPEPDR